MLPYSKQQIDQEDIDCVVQVLQSNWLTTGPGVGEFENSVADLVDAKEAVSFSSGTAALHGAASAIGLQGGDEVIVPAITFVATANAAVYCGAKPVFADVCPQTLLIDPQDVLRKISARTKAIFAVDYAGQSCDYAALRQIAKSNGLLLVSDSSHALGATFLGCPVASWVDLACYSFHPVKPITTCEGGMVVTDSAEFAARLREFRNHGIDTDHHQRSTHRTCHYDMASLGFNYRLSDVQSALGTSQLKKLDGWMRQRNDIANLYRDLLSPVRHVQPLESLFGSTHSYHLFVVRWDDAWAGISRDAAINLFRQSDIQANIHYRPVYQHSFYQNMFAGEIVYCPNAEQAYNEIMSLPIFPEMTDDQVHHVVTTLRMDGVNLMKAA